MGEMLCNSTLCLVRDESSLWLLKRKKESIVSFLLLLLFFISIYRNFRRNIYSSIDSIVQYMNII